MAKWKTDAAPVAAGFVASARSPLLHRADCKSAAKISTGRNSPAAAPIGSIVRPLLNLPPALLLLPPERLRRPRTSAFDHLAGFSVR